jgi:hypothetical protein
VQDEMANWVGQKLRKHSADLLARKEFNEITVDGRTIAVRPLRRTW